MNRSLLIIDLILAIIFSCASITAIITGYIHYSLLFIAILACIDMIMGEYSVKWRMRYGDD
jgi:hypothetical protein